jgi:dipeptidase
MHLDETIQGLEKAHSKVREKIEKLEAHKKSLFPHPDQEEQKRTLMVFKSYNPDVVVDDYDYDYDVVLR